MYNRRHPSSTVWSETLTHNDVQNTVLLNYSQELQACDGSGWWNSLWVGGKG